MRVLLLCLGLAMSSSAYSADESFNWLESMSGENSALSGSCDYIDNTKNMSCNLRQIRVSKKISKEDSKKELSTAIDAIDKALKTETPTQVLEQIIGDNCLELPEQKNKIIDNSNLAMFELIQRMCKKPSRDNLVEMFSLTADIETNTCNVSETDTGTFSFEPVNEHKWVSTNGPSGACGVVVIMTLERNPKHTSLWTYTQNRQYTNTNEPTCESLAKANIPMSFGWKGKQHIQMDCKYIKFGF